MSFTKVVFSRHTTSTTVKAEREYINSSHQHFPKEMVTQERFTFYVAVSNIPYIRTDACSLRLKGAFHAGRNDAPPIQDGEF